MPLYPSVPAARMAYDRDGSVGFTFSGGGVTQFTAGQLHGFNSEALTGVTLGGSAPYFGLIFPELRDIAAYTIFAGIDHTNGPGNIETSVNTTTGQDGAWTQQLAAPFPNYDGPPVIPTYRTSINPLVVAGVKGIRWRSLDVFANDTSLRTMHVYGVPSAGQNPDSLRVWQPAVNAEVAGDHFDYGDIPRTTTVIKTFRIHNLSAARTAHSITLSAEILTDAAVTVMPDFLFSADSITYAASVNIGDLAPGATSVTLYLKNVVPGGASLGLTALRLIASPAFWT